MIVKVLVGLISTSMGQIYVFKLNSKTWTGHGRHNLLAKSYQIMQRSTVLHEVSFCGGRGTCKHVDSVNLKLQLLS